MAEYIEREKIVFGVLGLTIIDPAVAAYADAVLHQIQSVPSADVAPVRHARWKPFNRNLEQCSDCEGVAIARSRFCPNCGAIMDG